MLRAHVVAASLIALSSVAAAEETAEPAGSGATSELGAALGVEFGGRTSPGGLSLAGTYLYRLTDDDWFDAGVAFTFGGNDEECFRDRDDELLCDHGVMSGFAGEVDIGLRRYVLPSGVFAPFLRGGLGVRGVAFSADDLGGLVVPLWLGGGVRARVADKVYVGGDALLRTGFGIYNRDLGFEPHATMAVHGTVEFVLY